MCAKKHSMFCIIKKLFFVCTYKMYLISAEGYKNASFDCLKIREADELWVSMKNAGAGLGFKNISDLVLKEIYGIYEKKRLNKRRN